ncbi:Protein of unknown function DUF881 [Moorella glycerini]|nr:MULTISPECIES: DUF881 domain-containing protein [Moorella]PRR73537.1 hypothetical protein MOST_13850 [Moorella stamsii]CEP69306.1 Protein of unknown function DUF881 [Moorella glycerini]
MRKIYLSLLLISLFSGLLVAWQWRSHQATAAIERKDPELIDIIHSLEKEDASLENTIADLRSQIEALQKDRAQGKGRLAQLQQEIEALKLAAGLTPVTGPGITVTLDDNNAGAQAAKNSSPATYNPEDYIIHDKNVLYLVNELKAAGAEAIAVNGQRIVTSSDIRCVGTVILVNSTRLAPPYEVQAIGNPDSLEAAIQKAVDFSYLKSRDFPVKVTKSQNLTLPAYKGGFSQDYVRLVKAGGQ